MDWDWVSFLIGFVPAAAGAALGWVKFLHELGERRRERDERMREKAGREKAETELLLIRRRGNAPFLAPDTTYFNHLVLPQKEPGGLPVVMADNPLLLCFDREEVSREAPKGHSVIFVIKNDGEAADKIRITLDGSPVELMDEPDIESAHGLVSLAYDYDPAKHGQEQTFEVWFQSRSGFEDTHRYRTRHGFRILQRIDPP